MLELLLVALACLVLLLPIRNSQWQKLRPIVAILALGLIIVPLVPGVSGQVGVRIQALHRSNEDAKASEIRIESVALDGEEQDLTTMFPGNRWIMIEGRLSWRSFDEGNDPTLFDQWPLAHEYAIRFQKSLWRGLVEVQIGNETFVIDCYDPSNYGESVTLRVPGPVETPLTAKILNYGASVVLLILLCILLPLLMRRKSKQDIDPGPVTRETWSDIPRMLSILFIIILGASGGTYEAYGLRQPSGWGNLLLYAFETFAFPMFIMLTGSFLLHRDEEPDNTLRKRLPSVLVPLVGLVAIAMLVNGFFGGGTKTTPPLSYIMESLFTAYGMVPLFLTVLVGLYIITPVIRPLFVHGTRASRIYSIALLCLIPSALYTALLMLGHEGVYMTVLMYVCCLGEFMFGAFLVNAKDRMAGKWVRPAIMTAAGFALTVGMQWFLASRGDQLASTPLTFGLETVIFCGGIFSLFMALAPRLAQLPARFSAVVTRLSSLAIGTLMVQTVLAHKVPSLAFGNFSLQAHSPTLWASVLLGVLYAIFALAISYIISNIPVFKRVIGLDWYFAGERRK